MWRHLLVISASAIVTTCDRSGFHFLFFGDVASGQVFDGGEEIDFSANEHKWADMSTKTFLTCDPHVRFCQCALARNSISCSVVVLTCVSATLWWKCENELNFQFKSFYWDITNWYFYSKWGQTLWDIAKCAKISKFWNHYSIISIQAIKLAKKWGIMSEPTCSQQEIVISSLIVVFSVNCCCSELNLRKLGFQSQQK